MEQYNIGGKTIEEQAELLIRKKLFMSRLAWKK